MEQFIELPLDVSTIFSGVLRLKDVEAKTTVCKSQLHLSTVSEGTLESFSAPEILTFLAAKILK